MAELTLLSSTPGGLTDAQLDRNMQNLNEELAGKLPLGGFGLGGDAIPLANPDLAIAAGYTHFGDLAAGLGAGAMYPLGFDSNWEILTHAGTNDNRCSQVAIELGTGRVATRSRSGGVNTEWKEVWTSGSFVKQASAGDKTAGRALLTGAHNLGVGSFAKNKIINGKMEIAQRGTGVGSPLGVETFLVDRWFTFSAGAASSITHSGGPSAEFPKALAMSGATGVTGVSAWTRLESKDTAGLSGKAVTLQAKVYSTDTSTLTWYVLAAGAVDNFTTRPTKHTGNVVIPAGWSEIEVVIPAFDTQAASNGAQIGIGWGGTGAGIVRALTGVQLEVGSVATPFEHRPYGQELALCERYYQKTYSSPVAPGAISEAGQVYASATGAGQFYLTHPYKCAMRATPTVQVYSPYTGAAGQWRNMSSGVDFVPTIGAVGDAALTLYATVTSNYVMAGHLTLSAEL